MKDMQGEMKKWAASNGVEIKEIITIKKKKNKEQFSKREIQQLMDMNRQTYRRGSSGAIRQR